MVTEKQKLTTPMARARGLGAAHEGSGHWLAQRTTAISNFFLMNWLAWSALTMRDWSYPGFTQWLAHPAHALPFICVILSVCYHASLGTQIIAEDYIHTEWRKLGTIIVLRFYFAGAAVAGVFSILKMLLRVGDHVFFTTKSRRARSSQRSESI